MAAGFAWVMGGAAAALALAASPVIAQQSAAPDSFPTGQIAPRLSAGEDPVIRLPSPILTLDWERLFDDSAWGKRIRAETAAATKAQRAENDRIAARLVAEEKALTEQRATMPAADFRKAADAFDAEATSIRSAQNAKADALAKRYEESRQVFFDAVGPLIDDLLRKRGAVVLLDSRAIIRGLSEADATGDLIALVDARLGDGEGRDEPSASGATGASGAAGADGAGTAARPSVTRGSDAAPGGDATGGGATGGSTP